MPRDSRAYRRVMLSPIPSRLSHESEVALNVMLPLTRNALFIRMNETPERMFSAISTLYRSRARISLQGTEFQYAMKLPGARVVIYHFQPVAYFCHEHYDKIIDTRCLRDRCARAWDHYYIEIIFARYPRSSFSRIRLTLRMRWLPFCADAKMPTRATSLPKTYITSHYLYLRLCRSIHSRVSRIVLAFGARNFAVVIGLPHLRLAVCQNYSPEQIYDDIRLTSLRLSFASKASRRRHGTYIIKVLLRARDDWWRHEALLLIFIIMPGLMPRRFVYADLPDSRSSRSRICEYGATNSGSFHASCAEDHIPCFSHYLPSNNVPPYYNAASIIAL